MVVAGSGDAHVLPARFEVVCWNVHKNADPAAALLGLAPDADLVLLQESASVTGGPPGYAMMVVAFRRARDGRPAGVKTVTGVAPTSTTALLSDTREPLVRTPKSALVSTVPLAPGGSLLVANVHGVNFRNARALAGQLEELDPLLREHTGPIIVAGDFNTWSRARHDALVDFAQQHGLESVFVGADAPRLDAVLFRGLHPEDSSVIPSKASDHDVLRVRFSVREAS